MAEKTYMSLTAAPGEIHHMYGDNVHLMHDPLALTWLARLCHPSCVQPEINRLITLLYQNLVREVINRELPRRIVRSETRMREYTEHGYYDGIVIDPDFEVTTVDIIRAGMLPSMVCYDRLNEILDPSRVRQDHIMMSRLVNVDQQVTGAGLFGNKIAGPVAGRLILCPDPMGATGGSMVEAVHFYMNELDGPPERFCTLNLIITPEYLKKIQSEFPDGLVTVYAYRLDRGLSDPDVLADIPGAQWDRERGLNDRQYIVPGAGGMGEIMNNALS
ncbi:MAG: uracil phosphoribosyltransferase [Candidatus Magasanikbacteria bacterium]